MKLNREDLSKALKRVAGLTKTRTTNPILSMVKLEALNGAFHVTATDQEVFAKASCFCKGELPPICVPPGPLMALSGYGPEEMALELDKTRLVVVSGARATLSVRGHEDFPQWPNEGLQELGVTPADFAECLGVSWASAADGAGVPVSKMTVWIYGDTKDHTLESGCWDGKRLAYLKKALIVPNFKLSLFGEHCRIIGEALALEKAKIRYSDKWVEVADDFTFACAVKQVPEIKFPVAQIAQTKADCESSGTLPRGDTMKALESMQSMAMGEFFVHGKATLEPTTIHLDYVGKVNEFHSVVGQLAQPKAMDPEPKPSNDTTAGVQSKAPITAAQNPMVIEFDAALLHNVLKNTPGESIKWCCDGDAIFFESGDLLTALALVRQTP